MKVCNKHKKEPIKIYSRCVGCELEYLYKESEESLKHLAEIRDYILGLHKSDGSDSFYEEWLMNTVPNPNMVPDLVKAEMGQIKLKLQIKQALVKSLTDLAAFQKEEIKRYRQSLEEITNFKNGNALTYVQQIKGTARKVLEGTDNV